MDLTQYEWLPAAAAALSALTLAVWYLCYFRAMRPKRGTLEWIGRTERGSFSPLTLLPVSGGGWAVLAAAALLGALPVLLQMRSLKPGVLLHAALAAADAVFFCLLLLRLYGSPVAALCGTVLLTTCVSPPPALPIYLYWMLWALSGQKRWRKPLLLLPLLVWVLWGNVDFEMLLVLASYCILYLVSEALREDRSLRRALGGLLQQLIIVAAVFTAATLLQMPPERMELGAVLAALRRMIRVSAEWDTMPNGAAMLAGTAVIMLLIQAVRLRDTRWLLGCVLAVLTLPHLFVDSYSPTYAGCILALSGTFAGADGRGGNLPSLAVTALLTLCIFIS